MISFWACKSFTSRAEISGFEVVDLVPAAVGLSRDNFKPFWF